MSIKNLSTDGLAISGRQSEAIELALSYQFKSMDLNLVEFSEQVEKHGIDHSRRLIDSARIGIGQFTLPITWTQLEDDPPFASELERLSKYAELAALLGCQHCVTTIAPASDELPYHENFERHRQRLGEIAEVLAPHDVQLGLEFHAPARLRAGRAFEFVHSLDAAVTLAESIPHENVGVVIDAWHCHVAETKIEEIEKLTATDIVSVYLSDTREGLNLDEADEGDRLMPGETGAIDGAAILTALAGIGYAGPVSVRCSRTGLDSLGRHKLAQLAGERLNQIWQEAGLTRDGTLALEAK